MFVLSVVCFIILLEMASFGDRLLRPVVFRYL